MANMLIDVSKMSHENTFDLTTVGHFAIDTILSQKIKQSKPTLGGPATYVSVAAAKLGAKVSVISKVGGDFRDEYLTWLRNNKVDVSGLKQVQQASTTRYALEYVDWERKLLLQAKAPPISLMDIPRSLSSAVIHVAPIANEIPNEIIPKLRRSADILSLDPQGFLRSFDEKGNVSLRQWQDSEVLAQVDILKSTVDEVKVMTKARDLDSAMRQISDHGIKIVIVTMGIGGSRIFFDNEFYDIPASRSKIVDPTGAGDAYIGAFLAEYVQGKDVLWCGSVGSSAASFVVAGVGPERFGEKDEVYQRAQTIYEKVTREQK
jgi:sugar/nucleoside kinase (ribokinase family)